ncbi:MAG: argininosuccinate lyase [Eubacteriales bacterium]
MSKLWGGRFNKATDKKAESFHSSISFDSRLYKEDILGSIAHAAMLGKCGIIPKYDAELIVKTLKGILADIKDNKITFSVQDEDIHMNIEKILISRIGDVGKKLHTGRSRNDQVALDMHMYMKGQIKETKSLIKNLLTTLVDIAENNKDTVMSAYTHLQKAQPTTLAHYMLAYFEMFKRDFERLEDCLKRTDYMPLGSGALCATTYPLNRDMVAKELAFSDITKNSIDAVSDRDYLIEFLSCASIVMMHLSRFCEELIIWSTNEFSYISIDDAYSTGSSIMPQKKNPDMAELIRGKTGRVYGSLVGLLTVMKALPLAYNKDMQEDKEGVFDACDTVSSCLLVFNDMLLTTKFLKDNMKRGASLGFTNATDAADYFVKKGIPFRDAHEIIGKMVLFCEKNSKALSDLTLEEIKGFCPDANEDFFNAIELKTCINSRNVPGGPSPKSVSEHIKTCRNFLLSI